MGVALVTNMAERIRAEIALAEQALRDSFEHYLIAGELLAEQKATLEHGQWLPWLATVGIGEREAQRYMRLAEHREQLEQANTSGLSDLSIERALKQVQKPSPPVDVAGALRGLGGDPDAGERLDAARERLKANAQTEWTATQQRKAARAVDRLEQAREKIRDAQDGSLSAYAISELIGAAAIAARHAAVALEDLAFTFER